MDAEEDNFETGTVFDSDEDASHQGISFLPTIKYLLHLEGTNWIVGLNQGGYQRPTQIHVVFDFKPLHKKRLRISNLIHKVVSSTIQVQLQPQP